MPSQYLDEPIRIQGVSSEALVTIRQEGTGPALAIETPGGAVTEISKAGVITPPAVTRKVGVEPTFSNVTGAYTTDGWQNDGGTLFGWHIRVPDDYVSGDIVLKVMYRALATGDIFFRSVRNRMREGSAVTEVVAATNHITAAADANSAVISLTFAAASIAAGDILECTLQRLGSDAADTVVAAVERDGSWIEYSGR